MSYIYLASPYTDRDKVTMESRFQQVARVTANYLRQGLHVYSPIVHCHDLAKTHRLPTDFKFWSAYNFAMLGPASHLHVLQLPGWNLSKGVGAEISYANSHGILVSFIAYPEELTSA